MRKYFFTALAASLLVPLSACGADSEPASDQHADHAQHAQHQHPADGGPVPAGMVEAANPTYAAGSEVTLSADHMPGMQGAPATIVGAYDTTAYEVTYTPVDGGEPVPNHKWVVQEEIKDAGGERLTDGTAVVLEADHMPGMQGAQATIDSSTTETVYVVDVHADGMEMTNHKWVVESEIQPAN